MKKLPEKAKISVEARVSVVTEQREFEEKLAAGKAVFAVPSLLTPMFISPKHVIYDEKDSLYKLNTNDKSVIPDGLIPESKIQDPAQLSTVLGRVLSVRNMLERGIEITILYVQKERPKADNKVGHVDPAEIHVLTQQFKNLHLKPIEAKLYDEFKTKVCAATYWYDDKGVDTYFGVDASQINSTTPHHEWGVKKDQAMIDKMEALNDLLIQCDLEPMSSKSLTHAF